MSEQTSNINSDPLNNIGNLYFRQGNYQRAVDYYSRAMKLAKNENNKNTMLNIFANLGEVYSKSGQGARAQNYFDSALVLCKELQTFVSEPQILKNMAANYYKQGKAKEAYEMMLSYDKAKEKIYSEESSRKIAQMEIALALQEKEKEVDALKKRQYDQDIGIAQYAHGYHHHRAECLWRNLTF